MIELTHNFESSRFMWLWAKYVRAANPKYHCTNSIAGKYSRNFNKANPLLRAAVPVIFDEEEAARYSAIYICGVSKRRYSIKQNYIHNVHAAIKLMPGASAEWTFEDWHMRVRNGIFLPIPEGVSEIPARYQSLPDEYTSCRIFRWAVTYFEPTGAG